MQLLSNPMRMKDVRCPLNTVTIGYMGSWGVSFGRGKYALKLTPIHFGKAPALEGLGAGELSLVDFDLHLIFSSGAGLVTFLSFGFGLFAFLFQFLKGTLSTFDQRFEGLNEFFASFAAVGLEV